MRRRPLRAGLLVDRLPRQPFRQDEKVFVELIARWLTGELQRHEDDLDWPVAPT